MRGTDDVGQLLEGVGVIRDPGRCPSADDRDRVEARVEQGRQGAAVGQVALVLEAVDFDPVVAHVDGRRSWACSPSARAVLDDPICVFEQGDQGAGDVGDAETTRRSPASSMKSRQSSRWEASDCRSSRSKVMNEELMRWTMSWFEFVAAVLDLVELVAQGDALLGEAA